MGDEEKKAIEYWKRDISLYHWNTQLASEHYARVILNLIEELKKELVQEKEKYKRLQNTEAFSECYISKDKLKEIKEGIELNYFKANYTINEVIDILKELLEEK